MIMGGIPFSAPMFIGFVCMLGVSIIAAPGVPGGAIMASLGLLASMLGFSEADQALMIALYIAMDSFGTACNVTAARWSRQKHLYFFCGFAIILLISHINP